MAIDGEDPTILALRLQRLCAVEELILDLAHRSILAYGGAVYPMDLHAQAACNRTLALTSGFRAMVAARNLICAGALLRMQLDTALRFYAAYLAPDPHAFAIEVLKGTQVRTLKDRHGKRLTDAYLVEHLAGAEQCEWLARVYRETSGYVHLSEKHMSHTFAAVDPDRRNVQLKVSAVDKDLPESIYVEAVDAFVAAAELFAKYLNGWGATKANPDLVRELTKRSEKQGG